MKKIIICFILLLSFRAYAEITETTIQDEFINIGVKQAKQKLAPMVREQLYYAYLELEYKRNSNQIDHQYLIVLGESSVYTDILNFLEND